AADQTILQCPRSAWPCLNPRQGREGLPASPSTTGMPSLWIAAFPAALVLAAAVWMLARGRRGGKPRPARSAPDAATPGLSAERADVAPATGGAAPDGAAAPTTDVSPIDPERVILQRLCARAYAGQAIVPDTQSAVAQSA